MADQGSGSRLQLVAAIAIVVLGCAGWLFVRHADAGAIARAQPTDCWTSSCREQIIQDNLDRITGRRTDRPAAR